MLTVSTQIPTSVRGKVRATVKAHWAWPDFLIGTGRLSASITNAELIAFALQHRDLKDKLEAILSETSAEAPKAPKQLFPAASASAKPPQEAKPAPAETQVFQVKVKIKAESDSLRLARQRHARLTRLLQVLESA